MKITHNKVGQNLNLDSAVGSAKSGKSDAADSIKNKSLNKVSDPKLDALEKAGMNSAKVDVSSRAQDAKRIKEIALATPDVDEAKVAKFRKLIDDGDYKIDAQAIADKMVDEHLETM